MNSLNKSMKDINETMKTLDEDKAMAILEQNLSHKVSYAEYEKDFDPEYQNRELEQEPDRKETSAFYVPDENVFNNREGIDDQVNAMICNTHVTN